MAPYRPMSFDEFKSQHLRSSAPSEVAQASSSSSTSMSDPAHTSANQSDVNTAWASTPNLPFANIELSAPPNTSTSEVTHSPNDSTSAGPKQQKQKKNKRVVFEYWRDTEDTASPAPAPAPAAALATTSESTQVSGWATSVDRPISQGAHGNRHNIPSGSTQGRGWASPPSRGNGNRYQRRSGRWSASTNPNDGNNLTNMMQSMSLGQNPQPIQRGPLTEFHLYTTLPTELRLKVVETICSLPRLLEMSWDIAAGFPYDQNSVIHWYHRFAQKSCRASAIMHVNREAREEAKRYYKEAYFTTSPRGASSFSNVSLGNPISDPFPTWYNSAADILVFGENTCMRVIVNFLYQQCLRETPINRLAILLSGNVLSSCCNWNRDDPFHDPNQMEVDYGYAIGGGCTVMQALHSIHRSFALADLASGVKGLEELFFIIPSFLTPITAGTLDDSIWFRPTESSGMTTGQVHLKQKIERDVKLVRNGTPLPRCRPLDNWTHNDRIVPAESAESENVNSDTSEQRPVEEQDNGNENQEQLDEGNDRAPTPEPEPDQHHNADPLDNEPPTFHFVSYTPAANFGDLYGAMNISDQDLTKLSVHQWAFMRTIEQETNVHLKVPERDFPGQVTREIGFFGKPEGIARAKERIGERMVAMECKEGRVGKRGYRTEGDVDYWGFGQASTTAAQQY